MKKLLNDNTLCKLADLLILVCIASAFCLLGLAMYHKDEEKFVKVEDIYPLCGIVTEVDYKKNYIVIEDFTGNLWIWEDAEDWGRKDIASMIMNNKGTETIVDDEIMKVYYSGWVE